MTTFLCVMWTLAALHGIMLFTCLREDIKSSKAEAIKRIKPDPNVVMAQWDVDFITSLERKD